MKNILVIAAHPDDELLGEGATIRKLVNGGADARAVILAEGLTSRATSREESDLSELSELQRDAKAASLDIGYSSIDFCGLPDNRMDGVDLLDIVKTVSRYIDEYEPDTIFTHHHGDLNIDHRRACEAVLTACRPVGKIGVERIYSFETPSSTEWNYAYAESFCPNVYFDVSDTLEAKIRGMGRYRSEGAPAPHPRSGESLRALAAYRGSNVGAKYAEAFRLLRELR